LHEIFTNEQFKKAKPSEKKQEKEAPKEKKIGINFQDYKDEEESSG
jgi:hypothetical protein